ncbi:hypothetical protein HK102_002787 [Quaeritorhiza haematococci]|nr:hypothetical protein HK102_002787 [Quaeritorhiza haematococci]
MPALETGNPVEVTLTPLFTIEAHSNSVSALLLSGGRVYSASKDSSIKEWDAETGAHLRTFTGHTRWVRTLLHFQNNVYSGSWDDTIREWDLESGRCSRVFKGHELGVNALAIEEDGGRLFSGSVDASIGVWNIRKESEEEQGEGSSSAEEKVEELSDKIGGYGAGIISLAYVVGTKVDADSGNETGMLFTGHSDGAVNMWDSTTGENLGAMVRHSGDVTSLAFIDGRLYSGGSEGVVHEWDIATSQYLRTFGHPPATASATTTPPSNERVEDVSVSSGVSCMIGWGGPVVSSDEEADDSTEGEQSAVEGRLLVGYWDGSVTCWDVATGRSIATIKAHTRSVNAIVLGDDGKLYTGSADGSVKSWDINGLDIL